MAHAVLQEKYEQRAITALKEQFGITNAHRVPKLSKVIVNVCMKEAVQDSKLLDVAVREVASITGQRPVMTRARKSISNFKLRAGMPIGCRVTLRRRSMYDFLLKLMSITLPRVRDFKGVSPRGFDGKGNYTLGLSEHGIFPEVNLDRVQVNYGMNITVVTTARNDAEGRSLLELLGMPFRKA
ncbi:MAG: 50S ribosomal protein L5 [Deltaproteobacteria bacterium]|nr:50S ribosomal protein L5 [Deltaproteobacteria bacterium]